MRFQKNTVEKIDIILAPSWKSRTLFQNRYLNAAFRCARFVWYRHRQRLISTLTKKSYQKIFEIYSRYETDVIVLSSRNINSEKSKKSLKLSLGSSGSRSMKKYVYSIFERFKIRSTIGLEQKLFIHKINEDLLRCFVAIFNNEPFNIFYVH